jgi:PAS domain S-box-containing protein
MVQSNQSNQYLVRQTEDLKREYNALKQAFDVELNERKLIESNLRERLKELNCHNQISELMSQPALSITDTIEKIVEIIPPSWQFPDIAQVSIVINENTYQTKGFVKSEFALCQIIKVNGESVGHIEVSYPENKLVEKKQVFLKEEKDLLFSIAVKIGNFVERTQKDAVIQRNEEKYRNLIESINEIIYEITSEGIIQYVSPSIYKTFGYLPEELIGKSVFNIIHEEDRSALAQRLASSELQTSGIHEYRFFTKSGEIRWMRKSTTTLNRKNKRITRIGTLIDITERKKSEEDLIKANRLYAVISQVNQAIVRTKNRFHLLEEICNIAIEVGKFRMSWIGIIDEKTEKIIPVAIKGYDDNYLSLIKPISIAETQEGMGPTGRAMREGHYFVCNDIENDPAMAPWKEEALKRGYRSSISLPIKQFGQTQAAYTLYASTPNFFNQEEIKLLEGISSDIGFALEAFASESGRKIAEEEFRKFKTINEKANFGSILITVDGFVLYANPAFAEMHQYKADELVGKHLEIVHNKEQMILVKELLKVLSEKGEFASRELWHTRKDGSIFPALTSAKVIFDENRHPLYVSATASDISELIQKEVALRQSEEALNYAQEIGDMGSWEHNLVTNEMVCSNNYLRQLGLKPGEYKDDLYSYFISLVHPDDLHIVNHLQTTDYKNNKTEIAEFRIIRKDGTTRWLQNNVVPFFDGDKLVALKGVNIDITEKKLVEDEIKRRNERLNAIVSAIPDLMFVLDSTGTNLEFYAKNTDKLLAPVDKFIGTNVKELFDVSTAELHLQKIRECIDTKSLITYDYSTGKAGSLGFFEARLAPLDGQKVLTFVRDITDKRRTEIQIRKLSQAVEQSPVIVVITGINGTIEYVNKAFSEISGYSYNEAIGQNPRILKSGKTDPAVYSQLWSSITNGKQWQGEWMNKKKNGELYWEYVVITPILNEQSEITNFLAVKQDITERKRSEKEIQELNASLERKIEERTAQLAEINISLKKEIEERNAISEALQIKTTELENFFSVALDLLCIADTSGNFIRVNKAWEGILGYSTADLEKRQFLEFVHPDDMQATLDSMTELSEQHPILNFTNRYLTKDGDYRFIEWRSSPSGNLIYAAARDITERIKAEEETKKAQKEAEQANLAKSEFLSRMSHELRTPMNAILGFAQLLEMGQLNPSQRKGVDHILRGGKHLLDLINEVLDISRIESGRISLSTEPVRLQEVLEEMIDTIAPLAEKRKVKVNLIDCPSNHSFVKADRQRLKQVLLNLINNSIKYNRSNGTVTISTKTINEYDKPEVIRVSISDTGPGINPDDLKKLFKPFERIGAEQTDIEGSGLGLAVVKKFVEAMNGKVGVESEVGSGSTFWIELPVTESQLKLIAGTPTISASEKEMSEKTGTVFCIEDNSSNIELIEQILDSQRPNIRLISNTNGKQVVSMCIDHKPNLILLDLNLPDMHGAEVLELIQNNKETKDIPVVIISADAMPQQLNKLLNNGAKKYLTKPLNIIEFLDVIDNFIPSIKHKTN